MHMCPIDFDSRAENEISTKWEEILLITIFVLIDQATPVPGRSVTNLPYMVFEVTV